MGRHGVSRTSRMGCPQRGIGSVSLGKQPMDHLGRCLMTWAGFASQPEGGSEVSAAETVIAPAVVLDYNLSGPQCRVEVDEKLVGPCTVQTFYGETPGADAGSEPIHDRRHLLLGKRGRKEDAAGNTQGAAQPCRLG